MYDQKGGSGKRKKLLDEYKKEEKEIKNIVYIKYADHVLYRNVNPRKVYPIIREALGWIMHEDLDSLQICWDKSVKNYENEFNDMHSGLTVLKTDILEVLYVKIQNLKISDKPSYIT